MTIGVVSGHDFTEDFDLEHPEFNQRYAEVLDQLVRRGPIAHSSALEGYWVVTQYEAVRRCAQDWRTFSSAEGGVFLHPRVGLPRQTLEEQDPPLHDEWRRIVAPYFTAKAVQRHAKSIEVIADDLIDEFVEAGHCEFVSAFSAPFPGTVFFQEMLGMPRADVLSLRKIASEALHGPEDQRSSRWQEIDEYTEGYLDARRKASPRGDVIDAILAAEIDGKPADWDQVVGCASVLVAGGLNTTSVVLSGAIDYFSTHPEDVDRVLRNETALDLVNEEVLRLYNPAVAIGRTATSDVEIGDARIFAGDRVFLGYAAACRDPELFEAPTEFDGQRTVNSHVAFGLGPHRCVGAQLVRLEMRLVVPRLLRRLRNLRRLEAPSYVTGQIRDLISLHIAFAPGTRLRDGTTTKAVP